MSTNILPLISSMGLLNLPCKSLKHVKMDKVTERGTFHAVGNKKKKRKNNWSPVLPILVVTFPPKMCEFALSLRLSLYYFHCYVTLLLYIVALIL